MDQIFIKFICCEERLGAKKAKNNLEIGANILKIIKWNTVKTKEY